MAHLSYSVGGDSNLVSFKSAARVPIDSLKVHFKPIQEGTGDPSPENVRPITGWTGVEAYKTGKNLFDQSRQPVINGAYYAWYDIAPEGWVTLSVKDKGNGADISGISFGVKSKRGTGVLWVLLNGQYIEPRVVIDAECLLLNPATNDALNKLLARYDIQLELGQTATSYEPYTGQTIPVEFHGKNLCPAATGTEIYNTWERPSGSSSYEYTINGLDPEQDYTLQVTITEPVVADGGHRLYFNGATTSFIDTRATDVPITKTLTKKPREDGSITITHNAYALYTNAEYAAALTNIQLELGSTATAYEPYNNTFYGGYVDIAKGELVQEWVKASITSADNANNFAQGLNGVWRTTYSLDNRGGNGADVQMFGSNLFGLREYSSAAFYYPQAGKLTGYPYGSVNTSVVIGLYDGITTEEAWKDWLDANGPLEICYKLSTPITYQLTPTELSTLLSTNNIWSNANDVTEVSYAVHDSAMIRAAKRRMAASWPKNYLDTAWTHYAYINGSGTYRPDTSDASSRMTNAIVMKAGTYRLKGTNTSSKETLTYRIHEYNASDAWVRQVAAFSIDEVGAVDETFTLDHDSNIRISMAIKYFIGRLIKIPPPVIDTSPKIAAYGYTLIRSGTGTQVRDGWCYTDYYKLELNGQQTIHDNNTDSSNTFQYQTNAEGTAWDFWYGPVRTSYYYNIIRFSIVIANIDDAYAFSETSGQIFFAGKNSPYYGYTNINDMPQA